MPISKLPVLACLGAALVGCEHPADASSRLRINAVGFLPDAPKQAFWMSTAAPTDARFEVRDATGAVVLDGTAEAERPPWNATWAHVRAIDLSGVTAPGDYTVEAGGATAMLHVADDVYATPFADALRFFRAQRDGEEVDPEVLERQPAHLHDATAARYAPPRYTDDVLDGDLVASGGTVDVAGGWFDAGDYVKFVETTSYAVALLEIAGRDDPDARAEAKVGLDWLAKAWDGTRLVVQVGIGDGNDGILGDHDPWRLPEADDTLAGDDARYLRDRPAFTVAGPLSPNLAGRLAADFALCAQLDLADGCLDRATAAFAAADTAPTTLLTALPHDYYPETEWRDDLELGAAELALATGDAAWATTATTWADAYTRGPEADADSFNLYDVSALAHAELYGITGDDALLADLRDQLALAADRSDADSFGYAGDGDPAPHALGIALTARWYGALSGDDQYAALGATQLDWVLGANAWGAAFVIGEAYGPRCPQHAIANLVGAPLLGGVVDGPAVPDDLAGLTPPDGAAPCAGSDPPADADRADLRYADAVEDWPTVEPAIDYTAPTVVLFAGG